MSENLEVESVSFSIKGRKILSDIYLKCTKGEVTGLLGRSGAGKSTLLNIIYGNLSTGSKCIRVDGRIVSKPYLERGLISYLSQHNFIPKKLSVKRVFSDYESDISRFNKLFPTSAIASEDLLASLSGGCRRLIEIFIVLTAPSNFVILDEPFSHLSPIFIEAVKELVGIESERKGIIVTDHLYKDVLPLCNSIYILCDGNTHLMKNVSDLQRLGYASAVNTEV